MTLELLDYYNNLWEKPTPIEIQNIARTQQENTERVILLQKMCFIEIVSAFEYSAKKMILKHKDIFRNIKEGEYI